MPLLNAILAVALSAAPWLLLGLVMAGLAVKPLRRTLAGHLPHHA